MQHVPQYLRMFLSKVFGLTSISGQILKLPVLIIISYNFPVIIDQTTISFVLKQITNKQNRYHQAINQAKSRTRAKFGKAEQTIAAIRISKTLKPVSVLIFISFVLLAFAKNYQIFLDYFQYIILIVFIHNGIALGSGYVVGKIARLPLPDQKTLAIETGIQNSGLGLLLIFTFFNGLGGMAIIAAWWGIWHIVSGLAIAYFWASSPTKQSV